MKLSAEKTAPVSLLSCKRHLRLGDDASDEALVIEKLNEAVGIAEDVCNRHIFSCQFTDVITTKCANYKDITTLDSVKNEQEQTIEFTLSDNSDGSKTLLIDEDAQEETYYISGTVGFTEDSLNPSIKAGILMILGTLYENISDEERGRSIAQSSLSAMKILEANRLQH